MSSQLCARRPPRVRRQGTRSVSEPRRSRGCSQDAPKSRSRRAPQAATRSLQRGSVVLRDKVRRHPNEDPCYHSMLALALAGLEQPEIPAARGCRPLRLLGE
jgi:hypothetical protein